MTASPPLSRRGRLFFRVCAAHFAGLFVTGLCGSIGTTAGFGSGIGTVMFLGALLSIPWFAALTLVIWWAGGWLSNHILVLVLLGPILVSASYGIVFGRPLLNAVAISSITSSVVLFAVDLFLAALQRWSVALRTT